MFICAILCIDIRVVNIVPCNPLSTIAFLPTTTSHHWQISNMDVEGNVENYFYVKDLQPRTNLGDL